MYLWDLPDEVLRGCLHRLQFPRILHLAAVHPQMALVSDMALASLKTIALHDFKDFEPLAVHRLQTEDNQRFLSVASIDGSNCKLSAAALSTLLAALPGARQIKLPGNRSLNDSVLNSFAGMKTLTALDLSRCCKLTNDNLWKLMGLVGNTLEKLSVAGCILFSDAATILEKCPKLKLLNLRACANMTDKNIVFKQPHGSLEVLVLSSCFYITNEAVERVKENCLKLRHLDLTNCWYVTGTVARDPLRQWVNQPPPASSLQSSSVQSAIVV